VITVEQLEKVSEMEARRWVGNCYGIACVAAPLAGGVPVYGHYLGPVHSKSMFAMRKGFIQHGWVSLPDGRILDPTRWEFEGIEPYIYVGPSDHYDEGGNQLRMQMLGSSPEFDSDEKVFNITSSMLHTEAWNFVESVLGLRDCLGWDGYEAGDVDLKQLQWLANQDPATLEGHGGDIYAMLTRLNLKGFIPIDNLKKVEREAVT
jgi:hypothetical protein